MSRTRIADFQPGAPTEGQFAVLSKRRRTSRSGDAFLALELSDDSGMVTARIWDNVDFFDRNVREGDVVVAVGKPVLFRNEMQFDVRRMQKVEGSFAEEFVPTGRRPLDEIAGEIDFLIDEITSPDMQRFVAALWQSAEWRDELLRSPATASEHHAHVGGLAEHTVNVASICLAGAERYPGGISRDLVLAAALVHDVGRARELAGGFAAGTRDDDTLYGHIMLGHEMLLDAGRATRVTELEWWPRLVHAVAQHHGPADRCRTAEAALLHAADALDARLAANLPGAGRGTQPLVTAPINGSATSQAASAPSAAPAATSPA